MSKSYTSNIISALGNDELIIISKLLNQFGKYKGYPIHIIERKLKDFVNQNRKMGHDDTQIALMIEEEWLRYDKPKKDKAS